MKKIFPFFGLLLSALSVFAQQETELLKLAYNTSGMSQISNNPYEAINDVSTSNDIFTVNINYGHSLKNTSTSLLYALSYSHFSQKVDVTDVGDKAALAGIPSSYYQYPNFSQISMLSGMNYVWNKKWSTTILGSINYTDDFSRSKLKPNFTWLSMAYLEKEVNKNFSYGFGFFINQLENKLLYTPSAKLTFKKSKMGFEILFPEKVRFWLKTKKKNYIEASFYAKSLSVEYVDDSTVRGTDIYTIVGDLGYNIIWEDFIKFKIGLDFPVIFNSIRTTAGDFEFLQHNSLGLSVGLSLIISND